MLHAKIAFMNTTRVIAWNTGAQAAGKVISTLFGVIIIALMTRYLGQTGFGYYSTANAFYQIFAIILDLGINVMIVQMLGEHRGNVEYENRAVSATMTFRIITSFVLLGIVPFVGLLFPYALPVKIAFFALWVSFFSASLNQIVIGVQQRHLKMHIVAISEVLGRAILLAGLIIAMAMHWGLTAIVIFVSIGSLVNLIVNWAVASKYACFKWNIDFPFWKELLTKSWPIGISIIFNLLYFKSDAFILSLVKDAAEVGIYSAAYRVLEILITFPFMLAGVMLPLMSHAWAKKNQKNFTHLIRQAYLSILLFAIPLVAGVFVLGTPAMILISGPEFALSGDILKILTLAIAAIYFGTISSHVVVAINAQMKMLPIYIVVAILTIIGYVIYIPPYGMWAAAWLTVFSEVAVAAGSTWFALRSAPGAIPFVQILKILLATIIMTLVIYPLRNVWVPVPVFVGMIIFGLSVILTRAIAPATIKEILKIKKVQTGSK